MKEISLILLLMVSSISFGQFVHPGITHKKSDLDRVKAMVNAKIDPWYSSYKEMESDSKSSYDYVVQGDASFTELGRDSKVNYGAWNSDIRAAYYNAIRWCVTEDTRHAEKAIEIFKAWSNLTSVTSGGTQSLSGGVGYIMIEAAELIKSTYSGWAESDINAFKAMLVYPGYSTTSAPSGNKTFYWMAYQGDPIRHGNQGLSGWRTVMAMGIFLDNEIMYERALRYVKGQPHRADDIAYPAGPNTSDSVKSSNEYADDYNVTRGYTIPDYGYNELMTNYIWENGQCQESSRDQQHTAFGIGLLTSMAEMAWNQGEDLYSYANDRLLLGLEYNMRYNVSAIQSYPDQTTPWNPTVDSNEFVQRFDRTGRWYSKAISPIGIGDFAGIRPVFEIPVAHYIGRGIKTEEEVKWTLRARDVAIGLAGYEAAGWTNDAIGWGGLTARRPEFCYGDPISGFDSSGLPNYAIHVVPNRIEAENFDFDPIHNGEGRVYLDLSTENSGAAYRIMDAVDVEELSEGAYNLTSIESGEWLSYTVSVPETAIYGMTIRYAALKEGGTIKISAGGQDKTTEISVPYGAPNSTGESDWKEFVISDEIILNKGVQSIKLSFGGVSEAFKLDYFTFEQTGVVKQEQHISFFTIPHQIIGRGDFSPGATSSSGLSVSYLSSNTEVAAIVDNKLHLVGTGVATITATQEGDATYNAASETTQKIYVVDAVAGTANLTVEADTYVRDGGNSNNNYGSDENIVTVASGRYGYLKFDLGSIPGPIISAKLRIYQRTTFKFNRSVYDVANDNWTETEITWNNKPTFGNERARITTNSAWNEWDISSYTAQEYGSDKIMTLVVKDPEDPEASAKGVDFRSKEFDLNFAPELVIEYSDVLLSTNNTPADKQIKIYPNPVLDVVTITNSMSAMVEVYDIHGKLMVNYTIQNNKQELDMSHLVNGVYILKIIKNGFVLEKKLLKK